MHAENYKRFLELIDKLREFEGAIIVEGLRDEVALRNLGVGAEIIRLSRLPLSDTAIKASRYHDVMILTDFDGKGEELARKLLMYLIGYECNVDLTTRSRLKSIIGGRIKGIEELYSFYVRTRERANRGRDSRLRF
ncbi:MAG: hypothetical protein GXO14_06420 [Thermococci archaeon]|nr:hypothetical protein [Thermococci archaeon]